MDRDTRSACRRSSSTRASVTRSSPRSKASTCRRCRARPCPPAATSASARWLQAAAIYRWISTQFDDDRNVFELATASQFDVRLFGDIHAFTWQVTVENAGDSRIEVGKTPLVTLAPGRSVRVGLTWRR